MKPWQDPDDDDGMRCQDQTCLHHLEDHQYHSRVDYGERYGACGRCPCERMRYVVPRVQQLQAEFARLLAKGLTHIPLTAIPDPTAERTPSRGIERINL